MTKKRPRAQYAAVVSFPIVGLRSAGLGLVLAGLLTVCPRAFALNPALDVSQYAHTAWKVRDGFVKGEIYSIAQTPDGYLWLGTEFGLVRFDGVRGVPWQPPPGEHLPSEYVPRLLAARDGTLWIGTLKGLASWKDGKLTSYAQLAGLTIFAVLEDREGTVWVGTYAGAGTSAARLCAIRNGGLQCYGEDGALGTGVHSLYEDSKGNLWVGVRNGLWRWKPGPQKFYPLPSGPDGIQGLAEDNDGTLLIGAREAVRRLVNGKSEKYPVRVAAGFQPRALLRDRDGGLWIGAANHGIVHVHEGRTDEFAMSDSLTGEEVDSFFEDREGNIWVATIDGLDRFRDLAVATFSLKQGLSNAVVGSVLAATDGSLWLGTFDGLNRWNNGGVTVVPTGSYRRDGKLNGRPPNSLFQDYRGRIWVSTQVGLGYLEHDQFIPMSGIPGGPVHSMADDSAGSLWIANQRDGLLQVYGGMPAQRIPWGKLANKRIAMALAADPLQGGLWLGFYEGDVAYFRDGQIRAWYTAAEGLGKGRVNDLRFGRDGTLWVATEGGLSRLKDGHVATLSSKNGLACDAVNWVMEDDDRSVWMYMACGLVRIARPEVDAWVAAVNWGKDANRTIQVTVFDSSDGVRTHSTADGYSPQVAKSKDGKLWFLPYDGVSVVDPRHLRINNLPPPVHIEQVTADRKTYEATSNTTGRLHLPSLVRDLTIDYTALSLVAPEKDLFRYKLEGRDRDWQDVGNRRQAFYTDLPPRNYRFRVIASNNSGVWNEEGASLDFSVAPTYYQTTSFRLLCVAAFLALLAVLHQVRLRRLAKEYDIRMEERVGERTRIARELHDSLLQGFQGLMFRLQAVRDLLPGQPTEAVRALDTALERGDKAIADGRDTVSDLRESIMGDGDIAKALTAMGEELAAQSDNGCVPRLHVLLEGKQREVDPILRDEIYRIAREALRNAFRHARAQKIEAEITYGDSEFLFHVRDDGIGIAPEVANRGARPGHWGLTGMRERAMSFGGKLEVWSEHGAGTEIKVIVPAAIAYGGSRSRVRRGFWFSRKKGGRTYEQS